MTTEKPKVSLDDDGGDAAAAAADVGAGWGCAIQ